MDASEDAELQDLLRLQSAFLENKKSGKIKDPVTVHRPTVAEKKPLLTIREESSFEIKERPKRSKIIREIKCPSNGFPTMQHEQFLGKEEPAHQSKTKTSLKVGVVETVADSGDLLESNLKQLISSAGLNFNEISEENDAKIASMSAQEISETIAQLQFSDPSLYSFLEEGGKRMLDKKNKTKRANRKETNPPNLGWIQTQDDFKQAIALHNSKSEQLKVKWMFEEDEQGGEKNALLKKKKLTRYDLFGNIALVETENQYDPTLHHHGEEPDRAGYTIEELIHLSRSTVPLQRSFALRALAGVFKTNDKNDALLFQGEILCALRVCLDDAEHSSALPLSIEALHGFLHFGGSKWMDQFDAAAGLVWGVLAHGGKGREALDVGEDLLLPENIAELAAIAPTRALIRMNFVSRACFLMGFVERAKTKVALTPRHFELMLDVLNRISILDASALVADGTFVNGLYATLTQQQPVITEKILLLLRNMCASGVEHCEKCVSRDKIQPLFEMYSTHENIAYASSIAAFFDLVRMDLLMTNRVCLARDLLFKTIMHIISETASSGGDPAMEEERRNRLLANFTSSVNLVTAMLDSTTATTDFELVLRIAGEVNTLAANVCARMHLGFPPAIACLRFFAALGRFFVRFAGKSVRQFTEWTIAQLPLMQFDKIGDGGEVRSEQGGGWKERVQDWLRFSRLGVGIMFGFFHQRVGELSLRVLFEGLHGLLEAVIELSDALAAPCEELFLMMDDLTGFAWECVNRENGVEDYAPTKQPPLLAEEGFAMLWKGRVFAALVQVSALQPNHQPFLLRAFQTNIVTHVARSVLLGPNADERLALLFVKAMLKPSLLPSLKSRRVVEMEKILGPLFEKTFQLQEKKKRIVCQDEKLKTWGVIRAADTAWPGLGLMNGFCDASIENALGCLDFAFALRESMGSAKVIACLVEFTRGLSENVAMNDAVVGKALALFDWAFHARREENVYRTLQKWFGGVDRLGNMVDLLLQSYANVLFFHPLHARLILVLLENASHPNVKNRIWNFFKENVVLVKSFNAIASEMYAGEKKKQKYFLEANNQDVELQIMRFSIFAEFLADGALSQDDFFYSIFVGNLQCFMKMQTHKSFNKQELKSKLKNFTLL